MPEFTKEELAGMFSWDEKGNTLISSEGGSIRAWGHITGNLYQEVSYSPENYPQLGVTVIEKTPEELAYEIMYHYPGWIAHKCNLEGVTVEDGYVCEP
jgi:hypothetical protein